MGGCSDLWRQPTAAFFRQGTKLAKKMSRFCAMSWRFLVLFETDSGATDNFQEMIF
jgi:hypothetical protein